MPMLARLLAAVALAASLACPLIAAEPAAVEVILAPRTAKGVWYFDVTVKNGSEARIEVPYIYDGTIEIDGSLYTQFPKPRIVGNSHRAIPPGAEEKHGTLTLNGTAFSTVDAKTGTVPLKLSAGEHTLKLILGEHQSKKITFRVAE